jgi:hypothetical protein
MRLLGALVVVTVGCGSSTVMFSDAGAKLDAGSSGGGGAAGGGAGGASGGAAGGASAGGSTSGGSAAGGSGGGTAGGAAGGSGGSVGGGSAQDAGVVTLNGSELCDGTAPDVTNGGRFLGTTMMAADDYSVSGAGCPSGGVASGRDVAYLLSPPSMRTYRVKVTPLPLADGGTSRFDPMLYVQAACGAGACLAGTVFNGPGDPEEVTFTLAAGQSAYVVVDGELASRGDFELEVSF